MGLSLALLGAMEIKLDGEPVTGLKTDKVRALLAYLAVERERPHRRQSLAGLLWPNFPEVKARTNLRHALANLRKSLGEDHNQPPYILVERETIQFNPESDFWLDVVEFEALMDSSREITGDEKCALNKLQEGVDLFRGPFLEGFSLRDAPEFDSWTMITRDRYQVMVSDALSKFVGDFERRNDLKNAILYAHRRLELNPWEEEGHRHLMRLLVMDGQRSAALAQYEACRRDLAVELGVEPSAETIALYEYICAEDMRHPKTLLQTGSIRGYAIREYLGSGHTGMVYRAFQPVINRDVAVKVILPQFANHPDFIRRFEVEAQLIARLEHPHIVPLYDYWRDPSGAYLVMRWLRGGSLQADLIRGSWKPIPAVILIDQIAAALSLAHKQGVVHCDIKPANILLDEEDNAYLSDFGIAILTGPLAQLNQVVSGDGSSTGSLGYISPEVSRGLETTPLADIYSLGVVLYEILTGVHPFPRLEGDALIVKHLSEPLPSVLNLRPELPTAVDKVIQKATRKDPAQRYQDAESLANAFRGVLAPETVTLIPKPEIPLEFRNPYKGLRPFQEADADDFFGRDELVDRIVERLAGIDPFTELANRFLAVVGPSGSGKSSVVKAGLIPAIRAGAIPRSERWFIAEMTPGAQPLSELETALLRIAIETPKELLEGLHSDPENLVQVLHTAFPGVKDEILLVIDQFEELFTLVDDPAERDHFLDILAAGVSDPDSPLRVVITLRADFYDRPLQHSTFGELVQRGTEVVLPLSPAELERAICRPAERVGVTLESALVARIVQEVGDQPGALPLLQYALTELFEHRERNTLTLRAYEAGGGVLGTLGRRAEAIYSDLDKEQQPSARQLFLRLVTLGEGTEDVRRRTLRSELMTLSELEASLPHLLDVFGRHRLLTFDHDPATRGPTVEVAHEALLREWPRLGVWLDESRDDIRVQRLLAAASQEWLDSGRDPGFLLRGTRLDQFSEWVESTQVAMTENERVYLDASLEARWEREQAETQRQAHEDRLEQRSKRFLRILVGVLAVATVIALVLTNYAFNQQELAWESNRQTRANELGSTSIALLDQRPDLAMLLSVEAYRQSATMQNWTALFATGTNNPLMNRVMRGHMGRIESIDFSPDGKYLASGGIDGTIRLWDLNPTSPEFGGHKLLHHSLETPVIECVAFNPEGNLLAASTADGHVLLWDVDPASLTFSQLLVDQVTKDIIEGGQTQYNQRREVERNGRSWIAFSPNSPILAAVPKSGKVELFNTNLNSSHFGKRMGEFLEETFFTSVAFNPDGKLIAAGGFESGRVYLLKIDLQDVNLGKLYETLRAPIQDSASTRDSESIGIETVVFSPGGIILAAGMSDGTIRLWDVELNSPSFGEHLGAISTNHGFNVLGIAFSPDGEQLASVGGLDQTAKLWNVNPESPNFGEQVGQNLLHPGVVDSVSFSPDGSILAVGSSDGGIYYWDLSPEGVPYREISQGVLGPTRRTESSKEYFPHPLDTLLLGHTGIIEGLVFSPNGKILASGGGDDSGGGFGFPDATIRLWDVDPHSPTFGGQIGEELQVHTDWISDLVYDSDGTRLASSSGDSTVLLWDVNPDSPTFGQPLDILMPICANVGLLRQLMEVEISPDGRILASGDRIGRIYLWDVDPTSPKYGDLLMDSPIIGSEFGVEAIEFSPDGKFIATASLGYWNWRFWKFDPIRLWNADPTSPGFGELVVEFNKGHTGVVRQLKFHPGGKILASASDDATIRLWDVDTDSPTFGQVIGAPLFAGQEVFGLAFSANGDYLASSSIQSGKIHLWDTDLASPSFGQALGIPLNQEGIYGLNLAFSPDGKFLAVGDIEYRVHLWNVDPEAWINYNCDRAGRNLTRSEWNEYLSWIGPYDPEYKTCPQWPQSE